MALIRRSEAWNPFREMEELSNRMSRLFNLSPLHGSGDSESITEADWAPSCDIRETDKEYIIRAEIPGVDRENVHVTLSDGALTIQGERCQEREEKGEKIHRRELSYGNFVRRFSMPQNADETQVDAKFKDGVLNVTIGKSRAKEKVNKTKEIAVH